jgi:signal transduction histidine kinase
MAVIDRQIRHIASLIDRLTDAANLDQGKVQLRWSSTNLCELLYDAGADHEGLFASREIQLCTQIPLGPICVSADTALLTQILGNLLQNAAQFTPPGGRVILALEYDGGAQVARIRVQDSGVGLEPGLRDRLFEPFIQADTSLARTHGGLGLGLTLVKGFVDLHGGSVRAESKGPGLGSTFIVELPSTGADPAITPLAL